MDRLTLAERRFAQLLPKPVHSAPEMPIEKLIAWVSDDVCPIVEEYSGRPAFRDQATWPLRMLSPGAATGERQLIEALDEAAVQRAKALREFAKKKVVWNEMVSQNPPRRALVHEEVKIDAEGIHRLKAEFCSHDYLSMEREQIDLIAQRFWADLVYPEDYLEPCGGWRSKTDMSRALAGEFAVALNPRLHPVGDFVTGCFMVRLRILQKVLHKFDTRCLLAARNIGSRYASLFRPVEQAREAFDLSLRSFNVECRTGPSVKLREACIVLTQVYVAFHPAADCRWLGLPNWLIQYGAVCLRDRLTRDVAMPDRIASALGDLRQLYMDGPPDLSAKEEAIASGGLVLVADPREVYWEGKKIDVQWARYQTRWQLLWSLAQRAFRGAAVGDLDLDDHPKSASFLGTSWGRLKTLLPTSLRKLVLPGTSKQTYRLHLEAHRIHLFETNAAGQRTHRSRFGVRVF
jgi:hypothetical protein